MRSQSGRSALPIAFASVCLAVLPVFLVGALAVQITSALDLSPSQLGLSVAAFWIVAATLSVPMNYLTQQFQARNVISVGILLSSVGCTLTGMAVTHGQLLSTLFVCGLGNSLVQPASAALLYAESSLSTRGAVFGIMMGAIPAATLVGGLAVPLIALTIGWRWAYWIVGMLGFLFASLLASRRGRLHAQPSIATAQRTGRFQITPPQESRRFDRKLRMLLVLLTAAALLAASATNSLSVFLVLTAERQGMSNSRAGLLLGAASLMAVMTRFFFGAMSDRIVRGRLSLAGLLLVVGAVFVAAMSTLSGNGFVVVALLAFCFAWGYPGLLTLGVIELAPTRAAFATSVVMSGTYLGGVVGPPVFGFLEEQYPVSGAWLGAALAALAGGLLMLMVSARHTRQLSRESV